MVSIASDNNGHLSLESTKIWYESLLVRYDAVKNGNASIDNKLSALATVAIAILVFELAIPHNPVKELNILGLFGTVLLLVCATVAFYSAKLRDTLPPAVTSEEQPGYYNLGDSDFLWQMISDLENAIKSSMEANVWKAKRYRVAFYLFTAASVLTVLSQFIDLRFIIR